MSALGSLAQTENIVLRITSALSRHRNDGSHLAGDGLGHEHVAGAGPGLGLPLRRGPGGRARHKAEEPPVVRTDAAKPAQIHSVNTLSREQKIMGAKIPCVVSPEAFIIVLHSH